MSRGCQWCNVEVVFVEDVARVCVVLFTCELAEILSKFVHSNASCSFNQRCVVFHIAALCGFFFFPKLT